MNVLQLNGCWFSGPLLERGHRVAAFSHHDCRDADGELERAFDLGRDPGEATDLGGTDAEWPAALSRRLAPAVQRLSEAVAEPGELELEAELLERLKALGYADE